MVVRIQRETTLNLTKEENYADKCFWREEQSISPETLESALSKNKQNPLLIGFLKIKMPKQMIETNTEKLKKYQSGQAFTQQDISVLERMCLPGDWEYICAKSQLTANGVWRHSRITRPRWGENEGWVVFFTPVSTCPKDSQGSNAQPENNSTQAALQSPTSAEQSFPHFPWKP